MEKFFNLPPPIKWILGVTGMGALIGTGSALSSGKWAFLLVLIILLVVVLGGYLLWMAWRRKKQNARLGGELAQHSAASPRGISDPGQRARLDDLRKKFESGLTQYRSRGKDLYKLPWYVIVGEPGSGKTEAVRHSNVGFPPGMQDEFQGVGGTINMNWWFTNHAVLLDPAGRLMFEEVKPGETSEWKEFLNLLKKNRPNCPINGLFLVIPSDSLIKDSADDIARKAGKIAQQLDVIQRVLDVRFPVFVIITKCDKIIGFREFFDGLTDPQLQHQIMGWSNPEPLDTAFRPELVDQHLEKVVHRLRRRRLGLMRDPVAEKETGRRTDEVDSLYALPHSLSTLAPRLRRYLETIFIAGEWSAKPLFLRGIYFSSSMREGSALDEELAQAIGVPVDELPEGKVWERDRAFFLRDLFIEKVFKERGLVTRANNTSRMLRTQQVILFGSIFAALLIFVAVAWLGTKSLKATVKNQSDLWVAATNWWDDRVWKQSIIPRNPDGSYASYATNSLEVNGVRASLGDFHLKLAELATKELKRNWMVPGLAQNYNKNSKLAQRIVFEGGVIKPLVDAARRKIARTAPGDLTRQNGEALALATLIRVGADALRHGKGAAEMDTETARNCLGALIPFDTGSEIAVDAKIVSAMVWTYATNQQARGSWPPLGLAESLGASSNSPVLLTGIEHFSRVATNSVQEQMAAWAVINELRNGLRRFQQGESQLFKAADSDAARAGYAAIESARKSIVDLLDKNTGSPLFQDGVLLVKAFDKFRAALQASSSGAVARLAEADVQGLTQNPGHPLFIEIQRRLTRLQSSLSNSIAQVVSPADLDEFRKLDELYLANGSYAKRWELYQQTQKLAQEKPFQSVELVGAGGAQFEGFVRSKIDPARETSRRYTGPLTNEVVTSVSQLLAGAEKAQREGFVAAYVQEAERKLKEQKGFPLARSASRVLTLDNLKEADKLLSFILSDLKSQALQNAPRERPEFAEFTNKVMNLNRVSKAILGDDYVPSSCAVSLEKMSDESKSLDQWRDTWRDIKLVAPGVTSPAERTGNAADAPLGAIATVDQKFSLQIIKNINAPNPQISSYDAGEI